MNDKLQVIVGVGPITTPPIKVDITKNDVVEDQLDKAIEIADLGDAVPGNGALDVPVTVKVRGVKIPLTISLDIVPS